MKRVTVCNPQNAEILATITEQGYEDVRIQKGGLLGKNPKETARVICGDKKKIKHNRVLL